MQHTLASPDSRFQIEQKEGCEDIVGNKARQPEVQNGNRLRACQTWLDCQWLTNSLKPSFSTHQRECPSSTIALVLALCGDSVVSHIHEVISTSTFPSSWRRTGAFVSWDLTTRIGLLI